MVGDEDWFGIDMFCSICEKDLKGMFMFHKGQPTPGPFYCDGCRRAVRIAQMKEAGTLPDLSKERAH